MKLESIMQIWWLGCYTVMGEINQNSGATCCMEQVLVHIDSAVVDISEPGRMVGIPSVILFLKWIKLNLHFGQQTDGFIYIYTKSSHNKKNPLCLIKLFLLVL